MDLPSPRGPLSRGLVAHLAGGAGDLRIVAGVEVRDPVSDDDLHLALWMCYELAYRGFDGIPDDREWDPVMLALRTRLEQVFLEALRERVPRVDTEVAPEDVPARLDDLVAADDGPSLSRYLERSGTRDQFGEFVIHRSVYHLKEADPHTWGLPRIGGRAKAALAAIQADEYGSGLLGHMHSELFRQTLRSLGLDDRYGAYVTAVPGATLAVNNLMSLFGLHRSMRGALAGHLAAFEMTSSAPNRRYSRAWRRLGGDEAGRRFFDVHVTADALHEQLAAVDLCGGLAQEQPALGVDILFGAACALYLDGLWADVLLRAWEAGQSSLRAPSEAASAAS